MARLAMLTIAIVLGCALSSAGATLIVVPQEKPPPAAREQVRKEPAAPRASEIRPAAASVAPRARESTEIEPKCSEALATLSLGIDDAAARESLKSRDCR